MFSEGFEFLWSWVFFLAPLPLLVYFFMPASQKLGDALWTPFHQQLEDQQATAKSSSERNIFKWAFLLSIWFLLLCAAARPQIVSEEVEMPSQARDIMLAVDISGSMEEADMSYKNRRYRRIDLVKILLSDFIERRKGDRLGLIVFGSEAYVHAPLTFDLKTISTYLQELELGFAGKATAIGDALGLAIKTLKARPSKQRILILLTDGSNTAGSIDPIEAAKLAAQENLKIYTIGIGSDGGASANIMGQILNFGRGSEIDEKTLNAIAQTTQGKYFRAKNSQDLEKIYQILDKLEPLEQKNHAFTLQKSLSHWPLSIAALLLCLLCLYYLTADKFVVSGVKHD